MTAICVFVQMIKFWFPQKSQYQFQLMLGQSMAEKLMILAVEAFLLIELCKISLFCHLHAQ